MDKYRSAMLIPPNTEGITCSTELIQQNFQFEMFPETSPPPFELVIQSQTPILKIGKKIPVTDDEFEVDQVVRDVSLPSHWTAEEMESFFCDCIASTWDDVVQIISKRICLIKVKGATRNNKSWEQFWLDYDATLGWLLGYWIGSVPLEAVLNYENDNKVHVDRDSSYIAIIDILKSHPVLSADCEYLRNKLNSQNNFKLES